MHLASNKETGCYKMALQTNSLHALQKNQRRPLPNEI